MSEPTRRKSAGVLFLGDLCFGASYGRRSAAARGFDTAFEPLDDLLGAADYVVANLETTFTAETVSPLKGKKKYVHRDEPEAAAALRRHGIHAVSLANNHAFDYGKAGLEETLSALDEAGIVAIGAGVTRAKAKRNLVRRVARNGGEFRIAVAAGKHNRRDYDFPYYARGKRAGVNDWIRRTARSQIRRLREAEPHAFLVAFPHWGRNYRWRTKRQTKLAKALIEAGADLVLGHGAHTMQEIERVADRWVVYSLGNSVFNTPGRYRKYPDALPYSLVARLCLPENGRQEELGLRLYPILSDNRRSDYRPRLVSGDELRAIRTTLIERSADARLLEEELAAGDDEFGRYLALPMAARSANE